MRGQIVLFACLLFASSGAAEVYHVAQNHPQASDDNPGTADRPWKTISKAASVLRPGDRVIVHAGVYREHVEPRHSGRPGEPIVYQAAEGEKVVVTGADVITGWKRVAGDRPIYRVPWPYKFIIDHVNGKPVYHHPFDKQHRRSGRAEQMIVDGKVWDWPQLVLSLEEMRPGTFFPDVQNGRLYIWLPDGSDPNAHTIEVSTRSLIFGTNPWARPRGFDDVHVRGFIFRYAANFPQRPAVWLLGRGNVLEDCLIEWTCGSGVGVGPEDGILRRCIVRNCGHTGGCAGGRNFLNEDCVWENNCRKPISRQWDAGGVKIAQAHDGIFQRCVFRDNGGPGLWLDIDVTNVVIRDCLFVGNEGQGLFVEISRSIYILNNAFFANGLRAKQPNWAVAGFTLAESRNCVVCNNLFVGNLDGISLREQGPRYLDTPDLGRLAFKNMGHVIVDNIMALNKRWQLGLWYDTAFFGRHPADRKKFKSEEEFAEAIRREHPDRWFDPLKQGIVIDHNLYSTAEGQGLVLYGVPWRVRHRKFDDLSAFSRATGFEEHGIVADPGLERAGTDLWRLARNGLAFRLGIGPRQPIAGLPTRSAPPPGEN